ncbi:MAG: DNA repair protein RadC [Acidobacteria bacterium]|nr:DNA repair protein RadC [Acidobacteriota bacterium]
MTLHSARQAVTIRELEPGERPRERLMEHGSEVLSDNELVAILIRTGRRGHSAVDLGRDLLAQCGGLVGLLGVVPQSLLRSGLGPAKAASLLAAVEVGRRLARARLPDRQPLDRPDAVADYLALRYSRRDQEVMGVLYLDTRQRLMAEAELFRGTLNRAAAEPRSILKRGLLQDAAGFILFHTHPSGDPTPSAEDLSFTRRVAEAGDIVGVRLIDHLIIGGAGRWVSLRKRGAW